MGVQIYIFHAYNWIIKLANASIDTLSKCINPFFVLILRKTFLKFEYKSDQEGENKHILVKTTRLYSSIEMINSHNSNYNIMITRFS